MSDQQPVLPTEAVGAVEPISVGENEKGLVGTYATTLPSWDLRPPRGQLVRRPARDL